MDIDKASEDLCRLLVSQGRERGVLFIPKEDGEYELILANMEPEDLRQLGHTLIKAIPDTRALNG